MRRAAREACTTAKLRPARRYNRPAIIQGLTTPSSSLPRGVLAPNRHKERRAWTMPVRFIIDLWLGIALTGRRCNDKLPMRFVGRASESD